MSKTAYSALQTIWDLPVEQRLDGFCGRYLDLDQFTGNRTLQERQEMQEISDAILPDLIRRYQAPFPQIISGLRNGDILVVKDQATAFQLADAGAESDIDVPIILAPEGIEHLSAARAREILQELQEIAECTGDKS